MEITRTVALISINETLIIQLVSFLVFLFLFNRLMIQPLRNVTGDRERYLERMHNEAEEAASDTQVLVNQIAAEKAKVRSEAFRISRQLEKEGHKTMNRILDEARETIARRRAAVQAEIGVKLTETRETMESEAEILAVLMMEKILGRRL